MQNTEKVQNHLAEIRKHLPEKLTPKCAIVLGTGLGKLAEAVSDPIIIPYSSLPGFPLSTVDSHKGQFVIGLLNNIPVIIQQGRCHLYEGKTPAETVAGIRTMAFMGVKKIILTNAAGSINPLLPAGELMLISDHINMTGQSPLTGINNDKLGDRFPDMSQVYSPKLMKIIQAKALDMGIKLNTGVYMAVCGPELETPAETRAYRNMGADAIGMSTVMEAIAAHHMGVELMGISCLSNLNLPDCMDKATLDDIIATASKAGADLTQLLSESLPELVAG